jgi:hypothetical protein
MAVRGQVCRAIVCVGRDQGEQGRAAVAHSHLVHKHALVERIERHVRAQEGRGHGARLKRMHAARWAHEARQRD